MTNERTGVKGDGERGDFVLVDGQFAVQHASVHGLHRNVKSAQHLVETLVCCMTHSVQRELRRFQQETIRTHRFSVSRGVQVHTIPFTRVESRGEGRSTVIKDQLAQVFQDAVLHGLVWVPSFPSGRD